MVKDNQSNAMTSKKSLHHYLGLNTFFFLFSNFYINIVAIFFSILAFIFYVNTAGEINLASLITTAALLGLGYYFSQYLGFTFIEHKHHRRNFTLGNRPKLFNLAILSSFAQIGRNFLALILDIVGLFIILVSVSLTYETTYIWIVFPLVTIIVTLSILSSASFLIHKNVKGNLSYSLSKFLKFNLQNIVSYILNFVLLVLALLFLYFLNFSFNNVIENTFLLKLFSAIFIYVYFNSLLITIQPQIDRELGEN